MQPIPAKSDSAPELRSVLKTASTVVDLTKNVLLIGLCCYLFFNARSAVKSVLHGVEDGQQNISHLKVGGGGLDITLTDKLTEAQKRLSVALDDTAKTNGKADLPVSGAGKSIVAAQSAITAALQSVTQKDDTPTAMSSSPTPGPPAAEQATQNPVRWVYLGQQRGAQWKFNYFNLTGKPLLGATVRAATDVYKRDKKPYPNPIPTDPTNWDIGDPVGVVHKDASIVIKDLLPIDSGDGGTDWWAQIN